MNRKALIIAITAGALSLASCSFGERQIIDQVANLVGTPDSVPATDPPAPAVILQQCDANGGYAEEGHCDTPITRPPETQPAQIFQQCDNDGGFAPEGQCPGTPNSVPATDPPAPTVIWVQCPDGSTAPEGECPNG